VLYLPLAPLRAYPKRRPIPFHCQTLSTVTGKMVSVKSFCLGGSGEEKLVFYIGLKIK